MTMKVTTNNAGAVAKDPGADASGSVDSNGKVTVMPTEKPNKDPNRPDWLPPEFKTVEEFRADYEKLKAPKAAEQAAKTSEEMTKKKVDIPALEKEYTENGGKLTDKSLADLKELGFSEQDISNFVAARSKDNKAHDEALSAHCGGASEMKTVLEWCSKNLSEADIERYNKSLGNTKDLDGAKDAMTVLQAKYEKAMGKTGKSATETGAAVTGLEGVEPIADMKELIELQKDPRYQRGNKAFHDMVKKRIRASPNLFGR
jgi:hypothetical protein